MQHHQQGAVREPPLRALRIWSPFLLGHTLGEKSLKLGSLRNCMVYGVRVFFSIINGEMSLGVA